MIKSEKSNEDETIISTNRQTDNVINFGELPIDFQEILYSFKENERNIVFLTLLASTSSIIPNIYFNYDNNKIYSNLYLYIVGKAGSGKGNAIWGRKLISYFEEFQVNQLINDSSLLEGILSMSSNSTNENIQFKILTPGNITSAGFMELLQKQNGHALIFETEGDTIANIHKTEHGNYSDMMRKAFHHEAITSYRKTDSQRVDIDYPRVSIVISSTTNQLKTLIKDSENGLFSRFMFIETEPVQEFNNIFDNRGNNREDIFKSKAKKFSNYNKLLKSLNNIEFTFTEKQKVEFLKYFNECKSTIIHLAHEDLDATVNRMGVIFVRICMVLDFIRNCNSTTLPDCLVCSDADFDVAKETTEYLLMNAKNIFEKLHREDEISKLSEGRRNTYIELPFEFTKSEAIEIATNNNISERTLDRFLKSALFEKLEHGRYRKIQS